MSQTWPSTTPEPTGSPGPSRAVTIGAIVAVVAMVAGVLGAAVATDRDASRPATSPAPTAAPADPSAPRAAGDIDEAVQEAMAFVEDFRGRDFKEVPEVEVLDDERFVERFDDLLEEDHEHDRHGHEIATVVHQALGVLPPGTTYLEAQRSFGAAGVFGFYDPETGSLTVRAREATPFARTLLVHELTHALDDQWFDLHRPEYDDAEDEVGFGLQAVAEGSARRVEHAYRAQLSERERREHDREQAEQASGLDLGEFTLTFLLLQLAPYDAGERFVDELVDRGGEEALAEAFEDPPRTSRQVLDVEAYLARAEPVEVPAPEAEGEVVDEGLFGEVALRALLEPVIGRQAGREAARGWAGDWYVAWVRDEVPCLRARFAMQTSEDLEALGRALQRWADTRPAAEVEPGGSDLVMTSCAR